MNISNQNNYRPNFKAIKVATTQNIIGKKATNIDLYRIQKEDRDFLLNLKNKIDYKKFFPNLHTLAIDKWKHILDYCVNCAVTPEHTTYIAINDGKPSGIISYTYDRSGIYLSGICSIPTEIEKKVQYGGQTMFLQLFKDALDGDVKNISLSAINNGPFNVVNKYEKLGFTKDPASYPYTKMVCNKYKIKEKVKELSEYINYEASEPEKVNLNQFLN